MLVFDVIVIGAGAAGMMCAATAGQRGRRVLLIDHAAKLGEKIRISGGGRCNFTNVHCSPERFLSRNPHFCRSALARYTPRDFIALVEKHGIAYHEKKLGQLFCDDSSERIIDMLRAECDAGSVTWRMPCAVEAVARDDEGFLVSTSRGQYRGASLVIATGGLSIPKIGATPFGYRLAEQFGLRIVPPRAGLVPLAFDVNEMKLYGDLAGVSLDVAVSCNGGRFRENLLFTHRGLSGPAILQISSYWQPGDALHIDLLPDASAEALLFEQRRSRALPATLLSEYWPRRFAQQWCAAVGATQPIDQCNDACLREFAARLHDWTVKPTGSVGYAKAEVTLGGIDTDELSSKTMEAKAVPGLYFIGEVVDVTGHLGGFNFQWAWASGHAAGQAL
ncbi:MAG TPA: NAD(P)/FAD-dependent oxidoreductase [Burkholderiales bacterium]|nr:NAD(P)/FAD-dependent oxidoreductase [Burkholderiales bacterium]